MSEYWGSGTTKAEGAARAVNRVIEELVLACRAGENVKARCYVSVIGYGGFGERVDCVVDGMISEVASALIAVKKVKKRILNGAGGVIEVDMESQHWKAQTNTHRPYGTSVRRHV